MKNFIISAMLVALGFSSHAQEAQKLRFGIDAGGAIVTGGGGAIFALEPKYNIKDDLNVGLRFETAGMVKEFKMNGNNTTSKGKFAANFSIAGTVDKYFSNSGTVAPYIGAGVGVFFLANADFDNNSTTQTSSIAAGTKLGGLIRAGVEISRFRMALEYNLIPSSEWDATIGSPSATSVHNSYWGIKIGFFIGGGSWGSTQ